MRQIVDFFFFTISYFFIHNITQILPELVLVMKGHNDMICLWNNQDLFLGTWQEVKGRSREGRVTGLHLSSRLTEGQWGFYHKQAYLGRESEKVCHWPECWGLRWQLKWVTDLLFHSGNSYRPLSISLDVPSPHRVFDVGYSLPGKKNLIFILLKWDKVREMNKTNKVISCGWFG